MSSYFCLGLFLESAHPLLRRRSVLTHANIHLERRAMDIGDGDSENVELSLLTLPSDVLADYGIVFRANERRATT